MTYSADSSRARLRWEYLALAAILLCAIFFRFYQLGEVPPGFNHDEAAGALDAQDALAGDIRAFYPREEGESTLWVYWLAFLFTLLGRHIWVVRAASGLVGVATVVSVYWMTFELFRRENEKLAHRLALLSALWLSLSLWHVKLSRMGWPAITMPLFGVLFFAMLWRAMRKGRTVLFVLSGVLLGLSLYTTQPTRLIPLLLAVFFLAEWPLTRRGEGEKPLLARYFVWLVIVAVIALLFFVPLLAHNVQLPGAYSDRVNEIALWNPAIHQGDPWGLLWRSVRDTLVAFGLTTPWNSHDNRFLDPLTAFFFVVGLLVALWRVRKPPYLFCLLWWPLMLLPTILAPVDAVPSLTRAVGALPVTYIFPAIGLMAMAQVLAFVATFLGWGDYLWRHRSLITPLLMLAVFFYPVYSTYHEYFDVFVHSELAHDLYHVYAVELARDMERVEIADSIFILPQVTGRSNSPDNTIAFLYRGVAPYVWLEDDETRMAQELTEACRDKRVAFLVNWKASKHVDADPRALIPFLLEKYGQPVAMETHQDYDIIIFELPQGPIDFGKTLDLQPTRLIFGGQLALDGYRFTGRGDAAVIPSDDAAWGVLRWRAISPMEKDYKASIVLEDQQGHHVSQVDRLLLGHIPQRGTSNWRRGETRIDGYRLSVPPAIPPGDYRLKIVVYDAENGQRLIPSHAEIDLSALLGTLPITRSNTVPSPEELPIEFRRTALISDTLQMLGIDGPASPVMRPGDQVPMAIYWRTPDAISQDYSTIVKLRNPGGEFAAGQLTPLGGENYPTSAWRPEEIVRAWYDIKVPADIPGGTYEWILEVTPQPESEEETTAIQLSMVTVEGLPRIFEVPPIQNTLDVSFNYRVALRGYELEMGERGQGGTYYIKPGRAFLLRLIWQTQNLMDESYTVFVHLLGPDDQIWAQQDRIPGGGDYPTTAWVKDEVIEDVFALIPAADAPAGDYQLAVGLYQAKTGERLRMYNARTGAVGDMALLPARLLLER
jgi:4-amino-4-deoxy-L-arabinose transferase-like glycosyltransferase